jgi:hypothetical protein
MMTRIVFHLILLSGLFMWTTSTSTAAVTVSGTLVQSLDGEWQSADDPGDKGKTESWFDPAHFPTTAARPAQVPGSVTETWAVDGQWSDAPHRVLWYVKTFPFDSAPTAHTRYYLRFGAVKQTCEVWLNGTSVGTHDGGESPFEFDVTSLLQSGKPNTVAVRLLTAMEGGIWQHVSLVSQPEVRIIDAYAMPDAKAGLIHLEVNLENNTQSPAAVKIEAIVGEFKPVKALGGQGIDIAVQPGRVTAKIDLPVRQPHLWNFNDPFLYTVAVSSEWRVAGGAAPLHDSYFFRTGFRDIRMVDGYFTINGRRFMVKSLHGNYVDPLSQLGTPRDMRIIGRDFPQLKKAGFNTFRFIMAAPMPEQLDQADEMGFFVFSEHETSWMCTDPNKFGATLNQVARRDRNHSSLILWGLLNETSLQPVYQKARDWLPQLKAIDNTRPIILSSGRFERDFKTASISNTGSTTWDVYMGGEDPVNPKPDGPLHELGAYFDGTGDAHIYPFYPLSWEVITNFGNLDKDNPHPFFLTESGIGSSFNPIEEKRMLVKYQAPPTDPSWIWANAGVDGTKAAWDRYGLSETYPKMEDFYVDSALEAARQRELIFSIVRGNPKINGYSLTSLQDFFGAGEGVMNNYRDFKPGHLEVLQAGWAPLRWSLLVNPTNLYADQPLRVKVALANEDALPAGDYPATLKIAGPTGVAWTHPVTAHVLDHGPFAYPLFDEDVKVPDLRQGTYTLEASLDGKPNAASGKLPFTVTNRTKLPLIPGSITVAGVSQNVRDLLTGQGANLKDYAAGDGVDRETILVGADFKGKAADWRGLYARAARGAHVVFLAETTFNGDKGKNKWLALPQKGDQDGAPDWLYHKDVVAKVNHPILTGLQTKLMSPEFYGQLLAETHHFKDMTLPADTAAVAIYSSLTDKYHFLDGVMIGTYPFHAGHFTINAFNIVGSMGSPATDRLLLNLVIQAQADAAPLAPLPADYDAEMDKLGITD